MEADLNPRRNNGPLIKDAPARTLLLRYSPPANAGEQLQRCALAVILKLTGGFWKEGGHFCKLLSVKNKQKLAQKIQRVMSFVGKVGQYEKIKSLSLVWDQQTKSFTFCFTLTNLKAVRVILSFKLNMESEQQ